MKNPIKNYFQQIYDETGKKPFIFLHACLCILVPIVVACVAPYLGAYDEVKWLVASIAGLAGSWGILIFLVFRDFKEKTIKIFLLQILASIAFWTKFLLIPLIKMSWRAGQAVVAANHGNVTASVNASKRSAATKTKKSAFTWFEYEGKVWQDEKEAFDQVSDYSLDEGSYSIDQNNEARNKGYINAKHAEDGGEKIG